jgi:ABC-2 type transport system ATP-binding protein
MRILTCFISATAGTAHVVGYDVFEDALKVRQSIGYLPQRAPLYTEMNVHDYLTFCADLRNLPTGSERKKKIGHVVEVCGIADFYGRQIGTLSHGQRQRVGLAQALVHDPPLLILDEPTADLDPIEKREFLRYLRDIGSERTVVLSTHNIPEVEFACSRAMIIANREGKGGRIVADGPIETIRALGGTVHYVVAVRTDSAQKAPSGTDVADALKTVAGVTHARQGQGADKTTIRVELVGKPDEDLRPQLHALVHEKAWELLEISRELPPLEDVFRELTIGA